MNSTNKPDLETRGKAPRRALSNEFIEKLKLEKGIYHKILKRVRKDKDLDMEFRGDNINIYFKGHSILNLKQSGPISINKKFLLNINEKVPTELNDEKDVETYLDLLPKIKDNVISKSRESEFEQLLIRANNLERRNNTEYIILDRQYVVNSEEDGKNYKWDLVALRWPMKKRGSRKQKGYLSVIEIKYALNSDIKNIKSQVERYSDYLEGHLPEICQDMKNILEQKLDLGLLEKDDDQIESLRKLPIVPDIAETEIIIYLIDYNSNSGLWKKAEEAGKPEFKGKVYVAFSGLALWQKNLSSFGENHGGKPSGNSS